MMTTIHHPKRAAQALLETVRSNSAARGIGATSAPLSERKEMPNQPSTATISATAGMDRTVQRKLDWARVFGKSNQGAQRNLDAGIENLQRASPVPRWQPTGDTPEAIHQAAARGTSGTGGPIPFIKQIQASFGRHDVSGVQAYTGNLATDAAHSIGAFAYTVGSKVAFAGTPSLHTAAHEAAHTVQQRAGVQLDGGVGQADDPYERHADAVADAVVAGRSSVALLDQITPVPTVGTGSHAMPVQMKGWKSRLTEMIGTLKARDPKGADAVENVLAELPEEERKAISEGLSLAGTTGRPGSKTSRDQARATSLFDEVRSKYLTKEQVPDMTGASAEELSTYLNSPAGFVTFREHLVDKLSITDDFKADAPLRPRKEVDRDHYTGKDYAGTAACYQSSDVMDTILGRMNVTTGDTRKHVISRGSPTGLTGRSDHKWNMLNDDKTIVDGTWKQFWLPSPDGGKEPTPEDWTVLNSQPDVFVGTRDDLRTLVESFNEELSVPFKPDYIEETLKFYEPSKKGRGGRRRGL